MKKVTWVIATLLLVQFAFSQDNVKPEIEVYSFEEFRPLLNQDDGQVYVINFWATWCKPCIKELPYFQRLHEQYKDQDVKVILVSLDFPEQLNGRVIPFVRRQGLSMELLMLNDPGKANEWINEVSNDWTGSIPATLIYNNEERLFFEEQLSYRQLKSILKSKFLKS